jgi:NAD(P)-dependent dehydrogenase (short-subunit alcohol dehydrogenase family)
VKLAGKVALVTGGSRGLGRAISVALAREGARVAINFARDEKAADETKALLAEIGPAPILAKADVTDRAAVQAMVKAIEQSAGSVDLLVNNAGVGQVVPLALMEEADWDRMMDTHVKGAFLVSQAVLRGMIKKKAGRILNVSSLAGVKMMQAPVHYSAAKAALKGFTEALAKEIGRYGVLVNCLAPGILDEGVSGNLPEARLEEYLRHCALGRRGRLEEVASVAAMLLSDRNSYMNGATVVLDGAV